MRTFIFASISFFAAAAISSCPVTDGVMWLSTSSWISGWTTVATGTESFFSHETPEELVNRSMLLGSAYDAWTRSGATRLHQAMTLSATNLKDLQPFLHSA